MQDPKFLIDPKRQEARLTPTRQSAALPRSHPTRFTVPLLDLSFVFSRLSSRKTTTKMSFLGGRGSTPAGSVNPERVEMAMQECVQARPVIIGLLD